MRAVHLVLLFCAGGVAKLRAIPADELEFFEKRVRPVLVEHCYKCHGAEKQKAELRLDSREAILKGTDLGPVLVPGSPSESSLIASIRHEGDSKMPDKADKLSDHQIEALTEWVQMGAPWPPASTPALSTQAAAAEKHWSFQPVMDPPVPDVNDASGWAKSQIDRFVLAELSSANVTPSPLAGRRTLIRRATLDLTGLPPTREEVDAFENDSAPEAFERLVDRLLASPRYGERWGRYWLDVARYADTKGYVFQEERRYPYSYTYRDWVIRAFNEDLPYDQFLVQQIAADHIATPDNPQPLAAMGFLTLGRRFLNQQPDIIDDRIDVISRGTMGLTVSCARCHDHKFDLVTQKDYYALYGVFASSTEPAELPLLGGHGDASARAEYEKELSLRQEKVRAFLAEKSLHLSLLATVTLQVPVILPAGPRDTIKVLLNRLDRDRSSVLVKAVDALNAGPLAPPRAMVMVDAPTLVQPRVFKRGNATMPGDEVPRRFISVLAGGDPKPFVKGSGRLELAQAIACKDNPLTARVMVNRVWLHHFGQALVRTPSDFGTKGEPPTHPELLDYLATRFVEQGWSLKKLHRLIMCSSTYQQSSDARLDLAEIDPEYRLLARANRRRLDFEAMRDALLSATGPLDLTLGGRSVELTSSPAIRRRSVYGFIDRQNLPGVFRTFDFASPDATSPQRHLTTVPQQALFALNSPFVIEQAKVLAASLQQKGAGTGEERLKELYTRVLAREPEAHEIAAGLRFLDSASASGEGGGAGALDAWEKYTQVLLATNEFIFVD